MKGTQFKLSYFLRPGETFHLARVNITSSGDLSPHSHDYAELLWIESGGGYHHINGNRTRLSAGDMVMVRPHDTHTFVPDTAGLTLMNIAFPAQTLELLKARYFNNCNIYFWTTTLLPFQTRLSHELTKRISARAEEVINHPRTNLQLDSLLLFIFRQITANQKIDDISEIPLWLFNAMQKYNSREHFIDGSAAFVALCNRNTDYVNRTVRQHFHKTLTELINGFRMQYAANQLSITNMPIKEICLNCGFSNLAHFYKVFHKSYGQTPREYRRINQTIA